MSTLRFHRSVFLILQVILSPSLANDPSNYMTHNTLDCNAISRPKPEIYAMCEGIVYNLLINLKDTFFDTAVGPRQNFARMCG